MSSPTVSHVSAAPSTVQEVDDSELEGGPVEVGKQEPEVSATGSHRNLEVEDLELGESACLFSV